MAARRTRFKPVICLPPRRKNNDAGNNTKTKTLEIESPQTPSDTIRTQDNLSRRYPRSGSPLKSPLPVTNVFKYQGVKVPSPLAQSEVTKEVSPKTSEKELNSDYNVFLSPKNVGSPLKTHVVSRLVKSSQAEVNFQRLPPFTPEKIPEMPIQKSGEKRPAEADVTDGKSKKAKKDVTCSIDSSDVPDYSSVTSMSESITEDIVMDGIVPLQVVSSAPKPMASLKNAIISENAEVLFDPILPLPSPIKVRSKLRPVPRLSSLRRNSVQGSASESEDESRGALLNFSGPSSSARRAPRQRHDSHSLLSTMQALPNREVSRARTYSVSSCVSQATTPSAVASSPVKDKHVSKSRCVDSARRTAAVRRRTEAVKKDTLTMYDLIFYNPSTNPIVPDQDEINAKEANEEEARKADKEFEGKMKDTSEGQGNPAPVPQIKLGPNGDIILDENSLVINQSEKRTLSSSVVHEGSWCSSSTVGRYRCTPRTKEWSDAETVRFYRALASLGTDFMMLEHLFPGRTRRDLKLKFKKEERVNMAQIDKALRASVKWDAMRLTDEFAAEREEEAKAAELKARAKVRNQVKEKRKNPRISQSSKALGLSALPSKITGLTANDIIQRYQEDKASKKKAAQKPRKRGRPKKNPSTPPATITQDKTNTQPTDDVATTRNIDSPKPQGNMPDEPPNILRLDANIENGALVSPKPQDNMPDEPSNILQLNANIENGALVSPKPQDNMPDEPSNILQLNAIIEDGALVSPKPQDNMPDEPSNILQLNANIEDGSLVYLKPQDNMPNEPPNTLRLDANIEDGSLVLLIFNDPNSPSRKVLQTYVASDAGKLTPVAFSAAALKSVITHIQETKSNEGSSPHLKSSSSEASQDSQPFSTRPSSCAITLL